MTRQANPSPRATSRGAVACFDTLSTGIHLLASLAIATASACGDDDGGGGTVRAAEAAVPLEWSAGTTFAALWVDEDRRSIEDLTSQSCGLDGAFVTATGAGSRVVGGGEGECRVVGLDRSLRAGASTLSPSCAGALSWSLGGESRTIMSCGDALPDRLELSCVELRDISGVGVTSVPGEADGDVITSLSLSTDRPSAITITSPMAPGVGLGLWPSSGDLVVQWEAGEGDGVEVSLGAQDGTGDIIECHGPDDGELRIPAALVEPRRAAEVWLRVARVKQSIQTTDGFRTTLTYRRSDTIYLDP
ncbi:MAG: hypothetical protein IT379_12135 [Deltaproteobacteria bacterium]|nr:hypothetical protein [Deltaproteobacteria bacterium]